MTYIPMVVNSCPNPAKHALVHLYDLHNLNLQRASMLFGTGGTYISSFMTHQNSKEVKSGDLGSHGTGPSQTICLPQQCSSKMLHY